MQLLTDLVARGTHVLVCDPERVRTRAADLVRTAEEFLAASWSTAAEAGQAPIDLGASSFRDLAEVETAARIRGLPWWTTGAFTLAAEDDDEHVTLDADDRRPLLRRRAQGRSSRCAPGPATAGGSSSPSPGPAPPSAPPTSSPRPTSASGWCPTSPRRPDAGLTHVTQGNLESGFAFPGVGLALLTEHDLTGQRGTIMRDAAKMPARRRNAVDLVQLQPGDLVVHEQHGIGRYIEMISRTVNGGQRDYLIVEYAPSRRNQPPDRLFVPDRLPRPADPLRRRRGAGAVQARRRRLEEHQEQGAQGGQADRRRADPAVLGADGDARATPSARTPSGSASSRTPSRSRRRPTSSAPSTRSRPT